MDKDDTLCLIRSLLITARFDYELQRFLNDFREEAGHSLPLYGFKTPLDFLKSIPDIVQISVSNQTVFLKNVQSEKSAHMTSLLRRQNRSNARNKTCHSQQHRPQFSQSSCNRQVQRSCLVKSKSDNWHSFSLGNRDTESFSWVKKNGNDLDCVNLIKANSGGGCKRKVTRKLEEAGMSKNHDLPPIIRSFNAVTIDQSEHGDGVIIEIDEIPKLELSGHVHRGEYVEVCVSEVYDPSKFSLQLRRFKKTLLNLMNDMQTFYKYSGDEYKAPVNALRVSQLCAALYRRRPTHPEWHRAVILKTNHPRLTVKLIDHGTVTEVDNTDVRFLHSRFRHVPAQAFMGCLGNIVPANKKYWSEESRRRFSQMVTGKEFIAQIMELSDKEMWVSVALTQTDGVGDLHVSDELIREGLAALQYDRFVVSNLDHTDANAFIRVHNDGTTESNGSKSTSCDYESIHTKEFLLSYTERNDRLREMFQCS